MLTYLGRIIDALDNVQMKHLLLQYLLAAPADLNGAAETPPSPKALRRRQSLNLLAAPADAGGQMDPSLFSLVDLLTSSLRSTNQETTVAAVRLISTILGRNHAYAIGSLLKVQPAHVEERARTHGALNAELEAYMNLAKTLGTDGLDGVYDQITKDALKTLEAHPCSAQLLRLDDSALSRKRGPSASAQQPSLLGRHRLDTNVGIFQYLAELVESFLTNNTEVNLSLTEAIVSIASCGQVLLEGWLSVEPSRYVYSEDKADLESSVASLSASVQALNEEHAAQDSKRSAPSMARVRRRPNWYRRDNPRILAALHKAHAELESVRTSVPNLDTLISTRRQALQLHDEISDAIANAPPPLPLKAAALPMSQPATPRNARDTLPQADRQHSVSRTIISPGTASRDRSKSPLKQMSTPRVAQSRSPPATPRGKTLGPLGGTTLTNSRAAQTPQRALSPKPKAGGLDPSQLLNDVVREADSADLARRFTFAARSIEDPLKSKSEDLKSEGDALPHSREASLSHILTNAAILRDFELELVALLQLRASVFDEVRFA